MRAVPRQIDEFAKAVGIKQDCTMCDLLHIDIQRQKEITAARESSILCLILLSWSQRNKVRLWQLATFTAVVFALLMAYASVHRG